MINVIGPPTRWWLAGREATGSNTGGALACTVLRSSSVEPELGVTPATPAVVLITGRGWEMAPCVARSARILFNWFLLFWRAGETTARDPSNLALFLSDHMVAN